MTKRLDPQSIYVLAFAAVTNAQSARRTAGRRPFCVAMRRERRAPTGGPSLIVGDLGEPLPRQGARSSALTTIDCRWPGPGRSSELEDEREVPADDRRAVADRLPHDRVLRRCRDDVAARCSNAFVRASPASAAGPTAGRLLVK